MLTTDMLLHGMESALMYEKCAKTACGSTKGILLYDGSAEFAGDFFYVLDWDQLPVHAPDGCAGTYFLCCGGGSFRGDFYDRFRDYQNVFLFSESVQRLHNHVALRLSEYNLWRSALRKSKDLSYLTQLVSEKTLRNVCILNSFFQRVTFCCGSGTESNIFRTLSLDKKLPYDTSVNILHTEKAAVGMDRINIEVDGSSVSVYPIRHKMKNAARILVERLGDGDERSVAPYIDDFVKTIKPTILTDDSVKQYFTDVVSRFISDIIEQRITDPEVIEQERNLSPDMVKGKFYQPVVIKFEKQDHKVPKNYISGQLEYIFSSCSVSEYNEGLLVIAAKKKFNDELSYDAERLEELLEKFNAYAGIGNSTRFLTSLRPLYIQAVATTRLGRIFCPDKRQRIFRYVDYQMYFFIDLVMESAVKLHNFSNVSYLCSPGVIGLLRYDKKNGTDLFNTARIYIECGCNSALCAQTLSLHRNTVNYRIKIIEALMNQSLDDVNVRMSMMISCYILDYESTYLGIDAVTAASQMPLHGKGGIFRSIVEKQ